MTVKLIFSLLAGALTFCSDNLSAATMLVDWLEFRPMGAGEEEGLIGSDSLGREVVSVHFVKVAGTFVPGSPAGGELSGDFWTSEFPFMEPDGVRSEMTTFQTQATGFGGEVNYKIKVSFMSPNVSVTLGVGQLFASPEGKTEAVKILAQNAAMEKLTIPPPFARIGWDDGLARNTLPLSWDVTAQSLKVIGLDSLARNSEFAFFDLGGTGVEQVEFEISEAYRRGSGDILEFSIGVAIPEPGGGMLLTLAAGIFGFRRIRQSLGEGC